MKKISRKRLSDLKICADYAQDWAVRLMVYSQGQRSQQRSLQHSLSLQNKNVQYSIHRIQMHVEAAVRNIVAILK